MSEAERWKMTIGPDTIEIETPDGLRGGTGYKPDLARSLPTQIGLLLLDAIKMGCKAIDIDATAMEEPL